MDKKAYVSGRFHSDSNWLRPLGWESTDVRDEASLIILPGGGDMPAEWYGEKPSKRYGVEMPVSFIDKRERADFEWARNKEIPVFGICKGLQMITALLGGKLIQNISHTNEHVMQTFEGHKLAVNSLHHQMCNPFGLDDYKIMGWCPKGTSPYYTMYNDKDFKVPEGFLEPEIIWYPNAQCLGTQWHPEMMGSERLAVKYIMKMTDHFIKGDLDKVEFISLRQTKTENHAENSGYSLSQTRR